MEKKEAREDSCGESCMQPPCSRTRCGDTRTAGLPTPVVRENINLQSYHSLACLAIKPPTLDHHFPAIHGDSAQTKGTVLLSIVSSS